MGAPSWQSRITDGAKAAGERRRQENAQPCEARPFYAWKDGERVRYNATTDRLELVYGPFEENNWRAQR